MTWLIVCRAVQGIGGGGILQLVQITISDIVSLEEYVNFGYATNSLWLIKTVEANMVVSSALHGVLLVWWGLCLEECVYGVQIAASMYRSSKLF